MKKILSMLLVAGILLTGLPVQQGHAETVFLSEVEWESEVSVRDTYASTLSTGPVLAEGNHVLWIDRIGELPEFAEDFYGWLSDNACADGALADPELVTADGAKRVYQVEVATGTVPFTYRPGQSMFTLAYDAVKDQMSQSASYITSYAFATYAAFDRDHPEIFWLSGVSKCGSSYSYGYQNAYNGRAEAVYTVTVNFYLQSDSFDLRSPDYRDPALIEADILRRDEAVEQILQDCPDTGFAYDQVLYFNKVLTHSNAYNSAVAVGDMDSAPDSAWECISALTGSAGVTGPVCEGYSRAFKVLCDKVGIPCVLVEGISNGGDHMWNNVQLDDSWYGVDVTWNDPVVVSAPLEKVSGYESTSWIGMGRETVISGQTFEESHIVENIVSSNGLNYNNGPVLSDTAYQIDRDYMDISPYRSADGYMAPVREGYVFAGWYLDNALTQPLSAEQTTGYAYAKFVAMDTLSLKFQTTYGTSQESAFTDLRLLTSVADLELGEVSFVVTLGSATQTITSRTVYRQVKAGSSMISDASQVFSKDSGYFVTYTLQEVPQAVFDTAWTVVPCWTTLDGTVVQGTGRTFCISETY